MSRIIRVLAAGCYGVSNVGDELLLATLNKWVRELGGELTVISLDPQYTTSVTKLPAVNFFDVAEIARAMETTDILVMGGGGIFQDHYRFNISALYDPASYEISSYSRPIYIAKQFGVPTVIMAHGVGPLHGSGAKELTRDIFSIADFISVRDKDSSELLINELGIKRAVVVAPDPSWSMLSAPDNFQPKLEPILRSEKKKIGLIVRSWDIEEGWSQNLIQALRGVLTSEWECVWIGFQTVRDTAISVSDRPFLEELSAQLGPDFSSSVVDSLGLEDAWSTISQCNAVLAMRLHGAVMSLAAGVPTLSYEYDRKMGLAMEMTTMPSHLRVRLTDSIEELTSGLQSIMGASSAIWRLPEDEFKALATSALAHRKMLADAIEYARSREAGEQWTSGKYDWVKSWQLSGHYNMRKRDAEIFILQQSVAERECQMQERDNRILDLNHRIAVQTQDLAYLHFELDSHRAMWEAMRRSSSWRITSPLRFIGRLLRYGLLKEDRQRIVKSLRYRYHRLPLPVPAKRLVSFSCHRMAGRFKKKLRQHVSSESRFSGTLIQSLSGENCSPDYFIWGVIDWHFRHQRPQQLAIALAGIGRRVFYISPNFLESDQAGFDIEVLDTANTLFQVRLFIKRAPIIYSSAPGLEDVLQLRASIAEVLVWAKCSQVVSLVDHPFWLDIAAVMPNGRFVYDCMDHHEGFGNNAEALMQLEKRLLNEADLTITTSTWLDEIIASRARHRVLIRNAGDYPHFSKVPVSIYRDPRGRRVIGYYGAIAEWFDLDLVKAVAKQNPDCSVLLIGADTVNAQSQLAKLPNVTFVGEVPYSQLPHYLHGFDVCLLPFKVIPLTLATNPVKAYEYLGAGKPVVTVDLPEMAQFDGLVYAAVGKDAFLAAVNKVLSQPEPDSLIQKRKTFAQGQTWQHRVEMLIQHAESPERDPKVSVIVVTYNNLDLTRACLTSLYDYSQYEAIEIIVVDNASSDGSREFLSAWVVSGENRQLIINDDNRGFAAANNQGLAVANGEYLVLLNNDTFVTPGWIRTLIRHLQRDKTIGLIGPVTNNIGNEAKIDISYESMDEMLQKAAAYTHRHIGQTCSLKTAAFFCVMMPRATYERVGTLDEAFGRGFFEDDDYCRRVDQIGLRVVCAEDVFIHHHLSASFNKLGQKERQKLFEANKKIFEEKWGAWVPHSYKYTKL